MTEKRWYDTTRWRRAAKAFLADPDNALCALCQKIGRDTPATIVDHKKPHKGDYGLFWDQENWQGVCAPCHSAAKRMQEIHGYSQAADLDGLPVDPGHPWNKKEK